MIKKKNVTIDDLAGMVQRGFLDLENRLGEKIDALARKMDQRFVELESRMSNLELRMGALEDRMDGLEESNKEIVERLGRIEQLVDEDYQTRIKRLEDSMRSVFERLAVKQANS